MIQQETRDLKSIYNEDGKINTPFLEKQAEILLNAKDYRLAANIYQTIHRAGDRSAEALLGLARCYRGLGESDLAISTYEDSIAYRPSLDAFEGLASLLLEQKRDRYAGEVLERAAKMSGIDDDKKFQLYHEAAKSWVHAENIDAARICFERALEIHPSNDTIRVAMGDMYFKAGKLALAIQAYREAMNANRSNAAAYGGLGACFLAADRKKGAHDYYVRSLELEINNPTAIFNLVKCAYELKLYDNAERVLKLYVASSPVNANLLYSLAGMQFHLGKTEEARATIQKTLMIQADHTGALELLNRLRNV